MSKTPPKLRDFIGSLLDMCTRYVPTVKPIEFDAQRMAEAIERTEAATVTRRHNADPFDVFPDDDDEPIPYTLTDKAVA